MQRFLAASVAPRPALAEDRTLVESLKAGDERTFETLVECYHGSLVRIAMIYVANRAAAEDVAQETWLAVLEGLERFEGRSSLKTWIFRILTNRAKTRGVRDRRQVPVSPVADDDEPEVPLDRFLPADDPKRPGAWATPPRAWPDERLLRRETMARLGAAIAELAPTQQAVIVLRDVEGFSAAEVAASLGISAANERVLLHRARSHVRRALESYFDQ